MEPQFNRMKGFKWLFYGKQHSYIRLIHIKKGKVFDYNPSTLAIQSTLYTRQLRNPKLRAVYS